MARKRFTVEQIIGKLREAELRLGQGSAGDNDLVVTCKARKLSRPFGRNW